MTEAKMQTLFGHWVKHNWSNLQPAAFELKLCKERLFNFKKIEDHQLKNLSLVKDGVFFYKIPDEGFSQKPFDCFATMCGSAYIVLMFYKPRKPKIAYLIPITVILGKIDDGKKSITEEEASRMSYMKAELKS